MKLFFYLNILIIFFSFSVFSHSASDLTEKEAMKNIQEKLLKSLPQKKRTNVITAFTKSEIATFYEVEINHSKIIYATQDGNYFIAGDLYKASDKEAKNLTEQTRSEKRRQLISTIDPNSTIIFKPKGKTKQTVFVFTDTDCYYCQKLHKEMNDYLEMGIEIQYLAYPRSGTGKKSKTYHEMVSIWCSKDQTKSMNRAKKGKSIRTSRCQNPVKEHYNLAKKIGVKATPAILFDTGELHLGYLPAKMLADKLKLQ